MKTRLPALNRIYAADATVLMKAWRAGFVDAVITDPPYGNHVAYGRSGRRIAGDEHPLAGLAGVEATYRLLKRDATCFMFCAARHLALLQHFFAAYSRLKVREVLAWDKRQVGFGSTFRGAYESILVLEKGRPSYRARMIPTLLSERRVSTKLHPHAKPVALLERLISLSTDPGALVLDPFAGSGSTGVAAANLGRDFVGIEIDAGYTEIANQRLAEAIQQRTRPPDRRAA